MNKHVKLIIPKRVSIPLSELPAFNAGEYELAVFDNRTVQFANSLSIRILRDRKVGRLAPFVALAFWLRRSNIEKIIEQNQYLVNMENVRAVPMGLVFHVCPSNVDTMFVYSLIISLLLGNRNVLRLSSKMDDDMIDYLFGLINTEVEESSPFLESYINVVTYERDDEINQYISNKANARVLWGGDETARTFKRIGDNVRCRDIVFSDRISATLIKAASFLSLTDEEKKTLVKSFYNDAYTFDQKGCSSPQQVMVMGTPDEQEKFRTAFFTLVSETAEKEYQQDLFSLASMKYNHLMSDIIESDVSDFKSYSNRVYTFSGGHSDRAHSCGGGYFEIKNIAGIAEVPPLVDIRFQTIAHFGISAEEISFLADKTIGKGVDRIVPIGKALDFNYIWDGYNLITELCSVKYLTV